jgi:hypothetical protein
MTDQQAMSATGQPLLSASNPWLASHFEGAATLLDDLDKAASCSDFAPECLDDQALADFIERIGDAWSAVPSEHDDESAPPPLELACLGRALFLLQEFLEREQYRRKEDQKYAAYCKESNETKRYHDAHNGQWPPAVLGGQNDAGGGK